MKRTRNGQRIVLVCNIKMWYKLKTCYCSSKCQARLRGVQSNSVPDLASKSYTCTLSFITFTRMNVYTRHLSQQSSTISFTIVTPKEYKASMFLMPPADETLAGSHASRIRREMSCVLDPWQQLLSEFQLWYKPRVDIALIFQMIECQFLLKLQQWI